MATLDRTPLPTHRLSKLLTAALAPALLVATIGSSPAAAQDASPAPEPSPSASAVPLPEGFNQKMVKKVGQVIDGVHPVRRLPAAEDVAYRVIDDETFLAELEALFREEYTAEYVAAEDDAFTRLGFLDAEDDLEALILKIYDSQVLAYYDPRTKTFSLIGP
ncbi:MAG: hypothetical protein U9O18_00570, partial [Chloroflexota bacterium]|nr:hypothetical protein [Chloroflexota bacterium]